MHVWRGKRGATATRATQRTRTARTAAVAAVLVAAASACAGGSGSGNGDVTVTYLTHWGPPQVKQLNDVAAAFHRQNPKITVKFRAVPFANLLNTVQTQGASPNGPTISSIYDLWLPQLIRTGAAAKAPADVASKVKQAWPANLVQDVSSDGSLYGIPNEVDLYALNYNKKLFAQAGIKAPPATWAELVADAAKLTDKSKGRQGFGLITNWAAGVDHPFLSLAASNGGSFLNPAKTASNLASPNVQAVASLYSQLISAGSTTPSMGAANANTTGPYLENFANGKTAMLIMANWWESTLKETMGGRFSDIATAPIPVGPSGAKSSSISYSWLTMVNAHASTAAQQAAWKFLDFLNGPASGQAGSSAMGDILQGQGIMPSRTSDLTAHQKDLSDPFIKTYVDGIGAATPFPVTVGGAAASDALQSSLEDLIFGRANAQTALGRADKAVNEALKAG